MTTPELQQATKLLQLPALALAAYAAHELEQDLFLEPDDPAPDSGDEPEADTQGAELTGSLVMDAGAAPGDSPRADDNGWVNRQRNVRPRGLWIDGFAPIGRGWGSSSLKSARAWRPSKPKKLRDHLVNSYSWTCPRVPSA